MTFREVRVLGAADSPAGSRHRMIVSGSIALLLVVAAAALRFYRLGHWSFALDEVATLSEVRALLDPTFAPSDSQIVPLPRLVPLGLMPRTSS